QPVDVPVPEVAEPDELHEAMRTVTSPRNPRAPLRPRLRIQVPFTPLDGTWPSRKSDQRSKGSQRVAAASARATYRCRGANLRAMRAAANASSPGGARVGASAGVSQS